MHQLQTIAVSMQMLQSSKSETDDDLCNYNNNNEANSKKLGEFNQIYIHFFPILDLFIITKIIIVVIIQYINQYTYNKWNSSETSANKINNDNTTKESKLSTTSIIFSNISYYEYVSINV